MSTYALNRRQFILTGAAAFAASRLGLAAAKSQVGLVQSTHSKLSRPAAAEQELDYAQVREMVFKAIEYGKPAAGSLEAKIKPGSWVVIRPNFVYLGNQRGFRVGDTTDMRVLKAVLEYVAEKSKAGRITVAEGGSYRSLQDPATDNVITQDGERRDATNYDWGTELFPGYGGTLNSMMSELAAKHPDNPLLVHALAWFLTDCPATQFRDPKRAVGYAKTVLQHAPNSARYWFTLAAAQYRAQEYSEANTALNKSIELANGGDARHWFLQAMVLFKQGDQDRALEQYRRAAQWIAQHKPADEELRRFRAEAAILLGQPLPDSNRPMGESSHTDRSQQQ